MLRNSSCRILAFSLDILHNTVPIDSVGQNSTKRGMSDNREIVQQQELYVLQPFSQLMSRELFLWIRNMPALCFETEYYLYLQRGQLLCKCLLFFEFGIFKFLFIIIVCTTIIYRGDPYLEAYVEVRRQFCSISPFLYVGSGNRTQDSRFTH